jgi:hypothetical protein
MSRARRITSFVAFLTLFLAVGSVAATGVLNVRNPEAAGGAPAIPPPLLAPPGQEGAYTPRPGAQPIAAPDARPVAQLAAPVADLPNLAVSFPVSEAQAAGEGAARVAFEVLASVQYTGSGGRVLVTTARPSPAALQQPLGLGNKTIRLANGTTAWVTEGSRADLPNRVVFTVDDLIITVAGDLPLARLVALAAEVVMKR